MVESLLTNPEIVYGLENERSFRSKMDGLLRLSWRFFAQLRKVHQKVEAFHWKVHLKVDIPGVKGAVFNIEWFVGTVNGPMDKSGRSTRFKR